MKYDTVEQIIAECRKVHGGKYGYTKVVPPRTMVDKIIITCFKHSDFEQSLKHHCQRGQGCPKCGIKTNTDLRRTSITEMIETCKPARGDAYDYSKTEEIGFDGDGKVSIWCKTHSEFFKQTIQKHMSGQGCRKCGNLKIGYARRTSRDTRIDQANEVHDGFYGYSKLSTKPTLRGVETITCPLHGDFDQTLRDHILSKAGCPKCKSSKGEKAVRDVLTSLNIEFEEQKRFDTCRDKLPLPFDFYLPQHQILIEYDGQQHYDPNSKWYSEDVVRRDHIKTEWAKENGFKLYRFRDIDSIEALTALLGLSRLRHEPV